MGHQERAEGIEAAIRQAGDAAALRAALQELSDTSHGREKSQALYEAYGPARLVMLTLSGYESPDAQRRAESAGALVSVVAVLDSLDAPHLAEQVWLILAAQQDVLLQRIEDDLEALQTGEPSRRLDRAKRELAAAHKLIRTRANQVVNDYLAFSYGQA